MRKSFVFLTADTSTYLPAVSLSAGMLLCHVVSQLSEAVEERQHAGFFISLWKWFTQKALGSARIRRSVTCDAQTYT